MRRVPGDVEAVPFFPHLIPDVGVSSLEESTLRLQDCRFVQSAVTAATPVVCFKRSAKASASPCTTLHPDGNTWVMRPSSVRAPS